MAFSKTANAVVNPSLYAPAKWGVKTAGGGVIPNKSLVTQASEILGTNFHPDQYLLTHCTIVASVDTFAPQGVKTGAVFEGGVQINRKFAEYRVTPPTLRYINNNWDCFPREVIGNSYRTFVGAQNFVEHVQREELSKGRIIDAVLRDIGDSLYVDILVATDRKHKKLIEDIESGKMATLSMGATVEVTQCTKCGHVAVDEPNLCSHVKYEKGNAFFDAQGNKQRVAEICGHPSIDPTSGVHFIEASWVAVPAFQGAVLRNIVSPSEGAIAQAEAVLQTPPPQWGEATSFKAAAYEMTAAPWDELEDNEADAEEEGEEESDSLEDAAKDLEDHLVKKTKDKIKEKMKEKVVDEALNMKEPTDPNDSLVKEASKRVYVSGLKAIAKSSVSDAALVNAVAEYNQSFGVEVDIPVYRAALKVGARNKYASQGSYLDSCERALGRKPTLSERAVFNGLAHLLSLNQIRQSPNNGGKNA